MGDGTSVPDVMTPGAGGDAGHQGDLFEWGKVMAANVLASLPPILIYAFLLDCYMASLTFMAGLTAGATKG